MTIAGLGRCWVFCGALLALAAVVGCDQSKVVAPLPGVAGAAATRSASLPTDAELRDMLDRVIEEQRVRAMSAQVNNAWQIVHGLLAYGYQLPLVNDGKTVSALEWMLAGGKVLGFDFTPGQKGLVAIMDPGSKRGQGHEHQWLGYMAQIGVPLDTPLVVGGETFKLRDLLTQTEWEVREGMEATWSLMAMSVYCEPTHRWTARDGSEWTMERLVAMEASPRVTDLGRSACGGSHRMYGVAVALRKYKDAGLPLTGGWLQAQELVDQCVARAREFQQPDGAFSTDYFQRSGISNDIGRRINTTGHMFEFLAVALGDEQLRQPWMTRAAVYLCKEFDAVQDQPIECGGLYHAAHGLRIYRQRLFGPSGDMIPVVPSGPESGQPTAKIPATRGPMTSASDFIAPPPPPGK